MGSLNNKFRAVIEFLFFDSLFKIKNYTIALLILCLMQFDQRQEPIIPSAKTWHQLYKIASLAARRKNAAQMWVILHPQKKQEILKLKNNLAYLPRNIKKQIYPQGFGNARALNNDIKTSRFAAIQLLKQYMRYNKNAFQIFAAAHKQTGAKDKQNKQHNCELLYADPRQEIVLACHNFAPLYFVQIQGNWYLNFSQW